MEKISLIYSQPAIEEVKTLINTFLFTFKIYDVNANDMFYYGVFCAPETYANYDWAFMSDTSDFEIPHELYSSCSTADSRQEYVKTIMKDIMISEAIKPEWMKYIENIVSCGFCDEQPSTFLYLIAKNEKYEKIGKQLINFLYSPNRTTFFMNN